MSTTLGTTADGREIWAGRTVWVWDDLPSPPVLRLYVVKGGSPLDDEAMKVEPVTDGRLRHARMEECYSLMLSALQAGREIVVAEDQEN